MSNINIPIEKFIPEAENILELLYEDCSGVVNIKGLDDLLSLPVVEGYTGDISRFKGFYNTLKDAVEVVDEIREVVDIIEPLLTK